MNGIYGYWDKKNNYVAYIGRDSNINNNGRFKDHLVPSRYDEQQFNRVIQNNPDRYEYFVLAEGEFSNDELNEMESQAIEIFKTYHYDYPEKSVFNFDKGGKGKIGYHHTLDSQKQSSNSHNNKTGFFRVIIENKPKCKKGFVFTYQYYDDNGVRKSISRTTLKALKKVVISKNLHWEIINLDNAKKTIELDNTKVNRKNNTTGLYKVYIKKCSSCKKGFIFEYQYKHDNKIKSILRTSLKSLEEEVKNRGLEWKILDEDKARETLELDK